jgi:predicted alpha-1,2-mannosidase
MIRPSSIYMRKLGCIGLCFSAIVVTVTCSGNPVTVANKLPIDVTGFEVVRHVDPIIGTGGNGHTFPGATVPLGMVQWSPDTDGAEWGWYHFEDALIRGFSVTHLSGAGCQMFGDFPILPWTGEVTSNPASSPHFYEVGFHHFGADGARLETAEPGYYSILLGNGVKVELTASTRAGIGRIVFPPNTKKTLLIRAGDSSNMDRADRSSDASSVDVVGNDTVVASVRTGGFCGLPNDYSLHISLHLDTPFNSFGVWDDAGVLTNVRTTSGHKTGAYIVFPETTNGPISLRFGISYVNSDNAEMNLSQEIPGWDFDAIRGVAKHSWSKVLSRILVEGGTEDQKTVFYTGFYHMMIAPNVFSDVNGDYVGFDRIVRNAGTHIHYSNFSDWDTYRTEIQLQALLFPLEVSDMMDSLVRDGQQIGSLPKWPVANDVSDVMGGDSPVLLLANAYAFGAHSFDLSAALGLAIKGATQTIQGPHGYVERPDGELFRSLGYVPSETSNSCVSHTLEYASADFAISRMAAAAGDTSSELRFKDSARNWINIFDSSIQLTRPRSQDGTFMTEFDADKALPKRLPPYEDQFGFEEGTSWQYTWMVSHDMPRLFSAMGGPAVAVSKLDQFFSSIDGSNGSAHFNAGNEPDFGSPYAYLFAGAPYKTQALVPRILATKFNTTANGLAGNDDLGALSGTFVWGALGIYPAVPGVGGFVIGTPMFTRVGIAFGDGRNLVITRTGDGDYIQSATKDGFEWNKSWIDLSSIGANTFNFTMGKDPNPAWGSKPDDLPPSY